MSYITHECTIYADINLQLLCSINVKQAYTQYLHVYNHSCIRINTTQLP
jgi:hypothetical protein